MTIRIGYAANHKIGVESLKIFLSNDIIPLVILLPDGGDSNEEIKALAPNTPCMIGKKFKDEENIKFVQSLQLDYIFSIHFPYIIPKEIIELPRIGVLNLHPAYLPYCRGWHTTVWAIYETTPFGVTLHWIDEGIDTGDIALQKQIAVSWSDTADSLYKKAIQAELELLKDAVPYIINRNLPRITQSSKGSFHFKKDIENIRRIDLNLEYKGEEIIRLLRALTTNNWHEAAFFEVDDKRYLVNIQIKDDNE